MSRPYYPQGPSRHHVSQPNGYDPPYGYNNGRRPSVPNYYQPANAHPRPQSYGTGFNYSNTAPRYPRDPVYRNTYPEWPTTSYHNRHTYEVETPYRPSRRDSPYRNNTNSRFSRNPAPSTRRRSNVSHPGNSRLREYGDAPKEYDSQDTDTPEEYDSQDTDTSEEYDSGDTDTPEEYNSKGYPIDCRWRENTKNPKKYDSKDYPVHRATVEERSPARRKSKGFVRREWELFKEVAKETVGEKIQAVHDEAFGKAIPKLIVKAFVSQFR